MPSLNLRKYPNLAAFREMDKALFLRFLRSFPVEPMVAGLITQLEAHLAVLYKEPDVEATPLQTPLFKPKPPEEGQTTIDEVLYSFFSALEPDLSPELISTLHWLDDLSTDDGHERLSAALYSKAVPADTYDEELDVRALAMLVCLEHPDAFQAAHDRVIVFSSSKPRTFDSKRNIRGWRLGEHTIAKLESSIGTWLQRNRRSKHCKIRHYVEGDELILVVERGEVVRSVSVLAHPRDDPDMLQPTVHPVRPVQYDSLRFDTNTGRLEVSAPKDNEREEYRKRLGEAWFGDTNWFEAAPSVTLVPLKEVDDLNKFIKPIPDHRLSDVRLVEAWFGMDKDKPEGNSHYSVVMHRGPDLCSGKRIEWPRRNAVPMRASFKVRFNGKGQWRRVELIPHNRVLYDKRFEWDALSSWLIEKRFLLPPDHSDDDDEG